MALCREPTEAAAETLPPSLRAQLSGGERSAPTEPAGETVPPEAAEGVCLEG